MEQFKATGIAALLNTIVFHTRMVDQVEEMLVDTSDLSLFCFYARLFEDHFQMCLEFPAQNRYIIAFPLICGHFAQITNEFCPEERTHIRERSLSVVNLFLDEMAKESKNIITTICDEHCNMSDRLLPKHCAALIAEVSFLTTSSFRGHRIFDRFTDFRSKSYECRKYDDCHIRKLEHSCSKSIHRFMYV